MYLNDAFGRHPDLTPVCFHHEQGAVMAAESYYRVTNRLVVLNVTTGPGPAEINKKFKRHYSDKKYLQLNKDCEKCATRF